MSRYHFKIWSCVIAAAAVANSGVSHAASGLPLRNGEYATSCPGGVPARILTNIGYYEGYLSPKAEGQTGYCPAKKVTIKGQVYSGSLKCDQGVRIRYPTETYRFSYTILNESRKERPTTGAATPGSYIRHCDYKRLGCFGRS
jgi:hypothetical protein